MDLSRPHRRWRAPTRAPVEVRAGAVVGAVVMALTVLVGPTAAGAQDPDDTTVTTTEDILQGPTTVPGGSTASTSPDGTAAEQAEADADTERVWWVVAALVGVAVALLLLTIAYWRRTRPVPPEGTEPDDAERDDDAPVEPRRQRVAPGPGPDRSGESGAAPQRHGPAGRAPQRRPPQRRPPERRPPPDGTRAKPAPAPPRRRPPGSGTPPPGPPRRPHPPSAEPERRPSRGDGRGPGPAPPRLGFGPGGDKGRGPPGHGPPGDGRGLPPARRRPPPR